MSGSGAGPPGQDRSEPGPEPCLVHSPDGAADLRPRERVRRHVHAPRPTPAQPPRGRPPPRPGHAALTPDEVARPLSRGVVSGGRASTVFPETAPRLYLDVGSHPEY